MQTALNTQEYSTKSTLYIAFELANRSWKLLFSNGVKKRSKTVKACDTRAVLEEIAHCKTRFKLSDNCSIVSCYEAGWEGFWLTRWLESVGIKNYVVESSSIEVNRKARRAKTDRVDAEKLISQLIRYEHGDATALDVIRVPDDEDEDNRHLHREREVLVKERGRHWVRIKSLLRSQGIFMEKKRDFLKQLEEVRRWDGSPVPPALKAELKREWARHQQVDHQIKLLEKQQKEAVREASGGPLMKVRKLLALKGVGWQSAWILVMEFFAWREFRNRRELGALSGLTPTPYQSGDSTREQGISKAGNRRIRAMMIELSWLWLRNQPRSGLSQWYGERFSGGGKRMRRIGIVALARKLLIALWRYVEFGEMPASVELCA